MKMDNKDNGAGRSLMKMNEEELEYDCWWEGWACRKTRKGMLKRGKEGGE